MPVLEGVIELSRQTFMCLHMVCYPIQRLSPRESEVYYLTLSLPSEEAAMFKEIIRIYTMPHLSFPR